MQVSVNDHVVSTGRYGESPDWVDIKPVLRNGPNKVESIVQNGRYGGCGGTLVLRLNGIVNPEFRWEFKKLENQLPDVVCFSEVRPLI